MHSSYKLTTLGLATLVTLGLTSIQSAHAQISGFGNGSGFTFNHGTTNGDAGDPATLSNGVLTITDGTPNSESNSVIDNTKQNITNWKSSFIYTATSTVNFANGFTFVIENAPLGASALGGRGDGLGWGGNDSGGRNIPTSAAVEFNLYSPYGVGTNFATAGSSGANATDTYIATGGVSLTSGDPILVNLSYSGTTLSETLTDTTTLTTYSTSYMMTNLASIVGANTAYVGFTGGTGGYYGPQTISNFTFAAAPEPSEYAAFGLGMSGLGALVFKARRRSQITS